MAHYIQHFVLAATKRRQAAAALHMVLVPHLTAGSVHKVAKNVTVMSAKGFADAAQSLLRHCEDWVGCEGVHNLAECCRAGKRVFFRHRNQTELDAWNHYKEALASRIQNGEMDYEHMVSRVSKKKMAEAGAAYRSIL